MSRRAPLILVLTCMSHVWRRVEFDFLWVSTGFSLRLEEGCDECTGFTLSFCPCHVNDIETIQIIKLSFTFSKAPLYYQSDAYRTADQVQPYQHII